MERKKVYNRDFGDMKKVCVVTGGGSGIGFAAAKEAAKKGYYVMIVGRNEKKLAGAVEELRKDGCEAEAYSCDVSDREHCTIWFAKQDAARFARKNARVLSITPGNFETPLGNLEKEEASTYLKFAAIKRNGRPEEIAPLYVALIDERLSYLTGTDILCDGGCIAGGASAFAR